VKRTLRSYFCPVLLLGLLSACSSPFFVRSEFHGGSYTGGIVENTDLSVIANIPNGEKAPWMPLPAPPTTAITEAPKSSPLWEKPNWRAV